MTLQRIPAERAAELIRQAGYRYVDVRSEEEFVLGHPAGAFNVPWQHAAEGGGGGMSDNGDFMRVMRRAFAPDTELIIGCRTGHRSQLAAARLLNAGYSALLEMEGGFMGHRDAFGRLTVQGWQQAALPVEFEPRAGRSYADLAGR